MLSQIDQGASAFLKQLKKFFVIQTSEQPQIMTSGGLLQLVAYGSQDVYITGAPQITFFRVVYRRHTNYAMESMEQTFTGNADFGRKVSCLVARNGDLIHKAYLQIDLPALTANTGKTVAWTRNIGHVLIDEVSVEIGGATIDKHYGIWFTIWNELTQVAEKEDGYNVMIGNTTALTTQAAAIPAATLYVPLLFWFNRNPGLFCRKTTVRKVSSQSHVDTDFGKTY